MKNWNLWTEGYQATGEQSGAVSHGQWEGETLQDAIQTFKDSLGDTYEASLINVERQTFWGCRFFDNESDARKSFG
jgi:hypothetical protein